MPASASRTVASGRSELPSPGSPLAAGETKYSIGAVRESAILLASNPLDGQIGRQVHHERDDEQQDSDHEQHAVMIVALDRLAQFGGDRGGQGLHAVENAGRNLVSMAGGH